MYLNKPKIFDAFCWHYDEAESLPENSVVLSSNSKSKIQSVVFERYQSQVWAVQYHPEFSPLWVAGLVKMRKKILLEKNIYNNEKSYNLMYKYLSDLENNTLLQTDLKIESSLVDDSIRFIEIENWINNLL